MKAQRESVFGKLNSAIPAPASAEAKQLEEGSAKGPVAATEAGGAPASLAKSAGAAQATDEASSAKKKKVSFYQIPAEEERARAAWMHTMGHTGHRTITSFMEAAVSKYTRELEKEYNDSKPYI